MCIRDRYLQTFFRLLGVFIRHPFRFFKQINKENLDTLINALKEESPKQIIQNALVKLGVRKGRVVKKTIPGKANQAEETTVKVQEEELIHHIDINSYNSNILRLQGWIYKTDIPIKTVKVRLNGEIVNDVIYGFKREDVAGLYKDNKAANTGFYHQAFIDNNDSIDSIELICKDFLGDTEIIKINPPYKHPQIKPVNYAIDKIYSKRLTYEIERQNKSTLKKEEQTTFFSLIMPVYNIDLKWLDLAINSIINQTYTNWELILVDDCSPDPKIKKYLKKLEIEKIKPIYLETNSGISAATNKGLEVAKGDYIFFMDHDDKLSITAFEEFAKAISENSKLDLLYSDEDKINKREKRNKPVFKPGWSPQHILVTNYFNHLLCVRTSIAKKVGFRSEFDGCQDWDFILRCMEFVKEVHHIPEVLYYWRTLESSIAGDGNQKAISMKFFEKCERAINQHLKKINPAFSAKRPEFAEDLGVALFEVNCDKLLTNSITIITYVSDVSIGTRMLSKLEEVTGGLECNIIATKKNYTTLISSLSDSKNKFNLIELEHGDRAKAKDYNKASQEATSEVLLFLDDEVFGFSKKWLQNLTGLLELDGVGAIGSKITSKDNKIYSHGVLHNMFDAQFENHPTLAFNGVPADEIGYFFYSHILRNCTLLSKDVFAIKKSTLNSVDGFDEKEFAENFFFEDLSMRLTSKGKTLCVIPCLLYTSPSPRDATLSRMPSSA